MKGKMKLWVSLLALLGLGFLSARYGLRIITPGVIQDAILTFGWMAPILYILLYTIRPLFLFPAFILSITGGMAFGPWLGTLLDLIGATLGSFLAFGLARKLGRDSIQSWLSGRLQLWDERIGEHGFKAIFLLRVVPLIPFDAVNYGAGLSQVRFRDYALATPLGIIPGAFAYNYLGHSLHRIFSAEFFFAIGLVVILMLVPLFVKRKKAEKVNFNYRMEQQK